MKELAIQELDERLQRQLMQARDALKKGGVDYVVQVCGELLGKYPSAYEVRALLWETLLSGKSVTVPHPTWLRGKSLALQFKLNTRGLLKKAPQELVRRCDVALRKKQVFTELFVELGKAARVLGWLETQILACQGVVHLSPEKSAPRLLLAEVLVEAKRPQQAIEHLEWVLAREPANADAQTLLKNASVAETLQRGNWEDTDTSFHSKVKDP